MGKLATELAKVLEAKRPACPVGKLARSLKPADREDLEDALALCDSSLPQNRRLSARDVAGVINSVYEAGLTQNAVQSHNRGTCSCEA